MEFAMSSALETFRQELRSFIATHGPSIPPRAGVRSAEDEDENKRLNEWAATLFEAGYVGADWPTEFGGRNGWTAEQAIIVSEELARAQVPSIPPGNGLVSRALIEFGSDEQRRRYLPAIRSGEQTWCQLFSEPGAGSDLASLRTKAVFDAGAGVYRVSGQKVWTTNGHWAQYGFLLARTDSEVPKHKGISAFIVDMSAPGVTVRPLREITGTSDFNEVWLDDVLVPADDMIGSAGQGWVIANAALAHERNDVAAIVVKLRLGVKSLADLARQVVIDGRPALENAHVQDRIGEISAGVEALASLIYANITRWNRGAERAHDAAMAKLMFSELNLAIATFAIEISGERGVLAADDPDVLDGGRWQDEWLYSRAFTIAGGSSEIMRNLIAERGLKMPR
jgi:alkylation response protein AidB-like acyl-CoA dehydrogenase